MQKRASLRHWQNPQLDGLCCPRPAPLPSLWPAVPPLLVPVRSPPLWPEKKREKKNNMHLLLESAQDVGETGEALILIISHTRHADHCRPPANTRHAAQREAAILVHCRRGSESTLNSGSRLPPSYLCRKKKKIQNTSEKPRRSNAKKKYNHEIMMPSRLPCRRPGQEVPQLDWSLTLTCSDANNETYGCVRTAQM